MLEDDVTDPTVERIALALRRPVDLGPGIDRAVMSAIRAAPLMVAGVSRNSRRGRRSAWAWLVRPRSIRFSVTPLGALAAASIALVATLFGMRRDGRVDRADERLQTGEYPVPVTGEFPAVTASANAAARTRDTVVIRQFVFVAPGAKQVALVGDFNDWDQRATPLRLVKDGNGMWTTEVRLTPGVYKYAFLVDGKEWKADPDGLRTVGDDFGRPSSVVTVSERRS